MRHVLTAMLIGLMCGGGAAQSGLDTAGIAKAIGREGRPHGDVYRVAFPRLDLRATVSGVAIRHA
jgi:hypothetical protein